MHDDDAEADRWKHAPATPVSMENPLDPKEPPMMWKALAWRLWREIEANLVRPH
jgi:hypothetical protein